jgi:hypothetical protein
MLYTTQHIPSVGNKRFSVYGFLEIGDANIPSLFKLSDIQIPRLILNHFLLECASLQILGRPSAIKGTVARDCRPLFFSIIDPI